MIRLREEYNLNHDGAFSLFVVTNGVVPGTLQCIEDESILRDIVGDWVSHQMIADDLFTGSLLGGRPSMHLLLRRRVYLPESPATREAVLSEQGSTMAFTLAFIDARFNFRCGFLHTERSQ